MESLPKIPALGLNDDILNALRKQYNFEKTEDMNAAIDAFEEWHKKQNHLIIKQYPREYIERLIILHKGSVERAKTHMDKLCTLRTVLPHFFEHYDVRNDCIPFIKDMFSFAFLPKLTSENHRVCVTKVRDVGGIMNSNIFMKYYLMVVTCGEFIQVYDYCDGFKILLDIRDVNIVELVKALNIFEVRQVITIAMEGYGFRIKGIYILTSSKTIDLLTKIMKQMFSAKIGDRIFVHKTVETLREVVSKDILPVEYGGTEKSFESIYEEMLDLLSTKEFMEHMQMMNQARTNENLRLDDTVKEHYMSIAGTFRTLSVD